MSEHSGSATGAAVDVRDMVHVVHGYLDNRYHSNKTYLMIHD
ncbi:hypothetical protein VQL36_08765 [Chengkuizengella sp. SCS-71B]